MIKSGSSPVQIPVSLLEVVKIELEQHQTGIKEYDLIQLLKGYGFFETPGGTPMPPHVIFQIHFMLFHVLYVLRDRLLIDKQGYLEIDVLKIQLLPYQKGNAAITTHDKLREYYLDLTNLENTTEDEINELIDSFWTGLGRHGKRDEALDTLGLVDPVTNENIRETYRKLVMKHHPDRGGDKDRLQAINSAITILLN